MLTLIEAPQWLPLSLAEVKQGARLDGVDGIDALIMSYLSSAIAQLDGKDGWLGRCLIGQTWAYSLDQSAHDDAVEARKPGCGGNFYLPPCREHVASSV
jgi:uncharacterized phiE125 gp8 family phage protein